MTWKVRFYSKNSLGPEHPSLTLTYFYLQTSLSISAISYTRYLFFFLGSALEIAEDVRYQMDVTGGWLGSVRRCVGSLSMRRLSLLVLISLKCFAMKYVGFGLHSTKHLRIWLPWCQLTSPEICCITLMCKIKHTLLSHDRLCSYWGSNAELNW